MKKIALNVKHMKEALVNNSGNQVELNKIWDTFQHMAVMGFITGREWMAFCDECMGWYVDETTAQIKDDEDNDRVIWTYNSDTQYTA